MAIVYIATNLVNGKRYIGATIHTLAKRMSEHKCAAFRRNKREKNMPFYRAVRKYGFVVFKFSELIACETEKVFFEEVRMIALLKPEYNATAGGEGCLGRKMSDYCRQKLSEGRSKPEFKEKLSKIGKTKENRKRFAKYQKLGPMFSARKVICLDDKKVFESASAAARFYGVARSALIELCLKKNGRKTVGGKIFMYFVGNENKEVA